MSGLLALLDDVAGIAKVAAASVDDVAGMSAKAGMKAAGAVIDDAAVTPKYVHGADASRELPIVFKIARGSIFNKVVILLPIALLLTVFAPWAITPLLMLGGSYLCFEGAEKVWHAISGPHEEDAAHDAQGGDKAHLEEARVKGAIKTDFILSAEIMTIALSTIPPEQSLWIKALVLFAVAVLITVAVYGAVALIVKADDYGLSLARRRTGFLERVGIGIVKFMPGFMKGLTIVGTAAMLWVGGNIVLHGLYELGFPLPYDTIHHWSAGASHAAPPSVSGIIGWAVTAFFDGIFGLLLGLLLIPVAHHVINPLISAVTGKRAEAH
ncbi:DUF808 domain-containing protein [Paracoccus sp. Z118]|uniref:DUF808 domain-containing protein n=1 Tax=Paracoccus sp. Z118 TaxID=2851017 RepID=UPI001C2BF002|nr:DUF808 domain-containing protein [Paracoccus sp. Z118]MBV0891698.1 DUF808 domain-containing protein [Paracoccus sp. Z118]